MKSNVENALKKQFEGTENSTGDVISIDASVSANDAGDFSQNALAGAGWISLDISESPSKGMYLPVGTEIKIRSATTMEIKHYSTMDDTNPISVEKHIDEIMQTNCKVILPDGTIGDNRDLTYFDRLHYLFIIREKTMINYDSARILKQVLYNPADSKESKEVIIDQKIFRYYELKKGIGRWYNPEERCFTIVDAESGINVNIYIPTIGVIAWIKNYVRQKEALKRTGEDIIYDEFFIKVLQYLVPSHRILGMEGVFDKYQNWWNDLSLEHHEIIITFISKLQIGIHPTILVDFQGGEQEIKLNFRDYRSLFAISSRSAVLFSDDE
jgi:hypothetical protein